MLDVMATNDLSNSSALLKTIGASLDLVTALTGHQLNDLSIQAWVKSLRSYSAKEIQQAFVSWRMRSGKFPAISDIVTEIDKHRFGGLSGAWTYAVNAARMVNSSPGLYYVVFEHPALHFAIESMGGLAILKSVISTPDNRSFIRRDFDRSFLDYRPGLLYPAGFGSFNGTNVVLVGDPERARTVYANGQHSRNDCCTPGLEVLSSGMVAFNDPAAMPALLSEAHLLKSEPAVTHTYWCDSWQRAPPTDNGNQ